MTPVMHEEATVGMPSKAEEPNVHPDQTLAEEREKRYRARQARILADPSMDPRLQELLLDRRLIGTAAAAQLFGLTGSLRITQLRKPARPRRDPHPAKAPTHDAVQGNDKLSEIGRWREWGLHTKRLVWRPGLGQIVLAKSAPRYGKPKGAKRKPKPDQA